MRSLAEFELFATVDEIREHLLVPGREVRKWTVPSFTDDPQRTVTIVASCDLGEPGGDYGYAFHLSLAGWHGDARVDLPSEDLDMVPLILDVLAPYAALRPGSNPFTRGPAATHVWVYFDSAPGLDPLMPVGSHAVTPWRAA